MSRAGVMLRALLALAVLTGVAHAEREPLNKLGFRIGFDRVPIAGHHVLQGGIGLGIEHPLGRGWRVLAEYEWLWLGESTPAPMDVELHGSGHRASLGVRHELVGGTLASVLHFYIDGEAGGGLGLFADDLTGVHIVPHAFAGARLGYTFRNRGPARSSYDAAFLVRAIGVREGAGLMFGIGFDWGG